MGAGLNLFELVVVLPHLTSSLLINHLQGHDLGPGTQMRHDMYSEKESDVQV